MSKRYEMEMTRTTFFTVTVYADSVDEALEIAENGDYENEHSHETEVQFGHCEQVDGGDDE